jgi:hypothetical protein
MRESVLNVTTTLPRIPRNQFETARELCREFMIRHFHFQGWTSIYRHLPDEAFESMMTEDFEIAMFQLRMDTESAERIVLLGSPHQPFRWSFSFRRFGYVFGFRIFREPINALERAQVLEL